MIKAIEDLWLNIETLNTVGGGSISPVWTQIVSDVTGRELRMVQEPESVGSVGTALTAAVELGVYPDIQAVWRLISFSGTVRPQDDGRRSRHKALYQEYRTICDALIPSYVRMDELERQETGAQHTLEDER